MGGYIQTKTKLNYKLPCEIPYVQRKLVIDVYQTYNVYAKGINLLISLLRRHSLGEEDCVTSPNMVCAGGYQLKELLKALDKNLTYICSSFLYLVINVISKTFTPFYLSC